MNPTDTHARRGDPKMKGPQRLNGWIWPTQTSTQCAQSSLRTCAAIDHCGQRQHLDTALMDAGQRRAVRFFWIVLIAATCALVAGNAVHAIPNASTAPPGLAAVVATAPTLVSLASTEGVSLVLCSREDGSATNWCGWP